jgi:hypothetical protein
MMTTEELSDTIPSEIDGKRLTRVWIYLDKTGTPCGYVGRYESDGTKTYRPFFNLSHQSIQAGYPKGELRPIYGIQHREPNKDGDTLFVVEGEKCVDALHQLGLLAVTSPGGANSASKADWSSVGEYGNVIVLPDNDDAGETYARDVVKQIRATTANNDIRIVELPKLPDKGDIVDFIQQRIPEWDGYSEIPRQKLDWLTSEVFDGIKSVADVANTVAADGEDNSTVVTGESELCRNVADVAATFGECEFPVHALGPILSGAVLAIREAIQAPLSLCVTCPR